jgi:6-phosphogluconolactonase
MIHQNLHLIDFARDSAHYILDRARAAIADRGMFRLSLAGGNTPREIYAALADVGRDLPWNKVQITFSDERCVAPHDKESNFRMAQESLLTVAPIPGGNVFRIRGEIDPGVAAAEYEAKLTAVAARLGETRYVHDLLLLGLGPDGHTASLFPGSPALYEEERNVIPTIGPKPPPQRITFTFPLINAAREVAFLVKEDSKKKVIEEVQIGDPRHPASKVKPATWLLGF